MSVESRDLASVYMAWAVEIPLARNSLPSTQHRILRDIALEGKKVVSTGDRAP